MHRISNLALWGALALVAVACAAAFDAVAGTQLLSLGDTGMYIAPIAAASLPAQITAQLEKIQSEVTTPMQELRANLHGLEQEFAAWRQGGHYIAPAFGGGPSIGAQALSQFLGEGRVPDSSLDQAVRAATENKKLPSFNSRITLQGSIRAALVNEGSMSSEGTTSVPSNPEFRGMFGKVQRKLRLLDVLPSRPTSSDAVEFVQVQASGEASEQDQEGDVKAELDVAGTLQRLEIATIAGWTAASKQVLADHAALQQLINQVIGNKVLTRLEHQLINGTGEQGKIKGLLAQAVTLLPQIGATPADIVGESLVKQADHGFQPNLVLLNPLDWFRIQLTRNQVEGEYLFGSPTAPIPPALWNTPVVTTPSIPEGAGMTLDTSYTTVLDREQLTLTLSTQHADFFIRNLVAILGELRAGLEVLDEFAVYKFDLEPDAVSSGS